MPQPTAPASVSAIRLTLAAGKAGGIFSACSGLGTETEVIEFRSGTDPADVRRIPGETRPLPLRLERGLDASRELWRWRATLLTGGLDAARTDGTVELLDATGAPLAAFAFRAGWPSRYEARADARGGPAVEEVLIAHEGIERTA